MARRRMIDPNFWGSEDVSRLSPLARLLLVGMISNADDEGRGRGNPAYLRSTVFPYDEMPSSDIADMLSEISRWINVALYTLNNQQYYAFVNWTKWQRVDKPQKSIIPAPENAHSKNDSKNESENDSSPKEKKEREAKLSKENEEEDARANADSFKPDHVDREWKRVVDSYLANIGMLPGGRSAEMLLTNFDDFGADVMIAAIEQTNLRQPKSPFSFLQKVLSEWADLGVDSVEKAHAAILDHQRKGGAPPGRAKQVPFSEMTGFLESG
jgi:Replication initiation and membrane attachment protein (DnaB).